MSDEFLNIPNLLDQSSKERFHYILENVTFSLWEILPERDLMFIYLIPTLDHEQAMVRAVIPARERARESKLNSFRNSVRLYNQCKEKMKLDSRCKLGFEGRLNRG